MKTQLILNSMVINVNFITMPSLPSAAAGWNTSVCAPGRGSGMVQASPPASFPMITPDRGHDSYLETRHQLEPSFKLKLYAPWLGNEMQKQEILWQSLLVGSSPFKTANASKLTESQRKDLKTHLNDWPISGLSVVANYKNILCAFSGNLILLP